MTFNHDGYDLVWDERRNNGCGGFIYYEHHDEDAEHKALVNDFNAGLKSDPHGH